MSSARARYGFVTLTALTAVGAAALALLSRDESEVTSVRPAAFDPAITTIYPVAEPRGVMVTSGGWAYCNLVRDLAREAALTLMCGRYYKDGFVGFGQEAKRHRDWGDPSYLTSLAGKIRAVHARVGGDLVLIGVSYSGFGVATLASHHPEIRPRRIIVIDSYLDLVARRARAPNSSRTAQEIDTETGGPKAALRPRSVSVPGLVRLVRTGTRLSVIWSTSEAERRRYRGATCDRSASAGKLSELAVALGRPVHAWVTSSEHGATLWHFGPRLLRGANPGHEVVFAPDGVIPSAAVCQRSEEGRAVG